MTLNEFINSDLRNAWVSRKGFKGIYVRKGPKYVNGIKYEMVLDIANIEARIPGKGAFKALIAWLDENWKGPIYVENVHSEKFKKGLLKLGFKLIYTECFFKE